jgi:hypothetical protein
MKQRRGAACKNIGRLRCRDPIVNTRKEAETCPLRHGSHLGMILETVKDNKLQIYGQNCCDVSAPMCGFSHARKVRKGISGRKRRWFDIGCCAGQHQLLSCFRERQLFACPIASVALSDASSTKPSLHGQNPHLQHHPLDFVRSEPTLVDSRYESTSFRSKKGGRLNFHTREKVVE